MGINGKVFSLIGVLVLLGSATAAEAQTFDTTGEIIWNSARSDRNSRRHGRQRGEEAPRGYAGLGARPRRWCGWWMRTQRGGGPELNIAWNWSRWGSPTTAQVGAVVVWRHHVGEITGRTASGQWIVRSGNDGGAVRERPRSVAGAVFRI
jgi:hypothetical protein